MKLSNIRRDVNLAENGVWVTNALGDIDLLIASANNTKYMEMIRKALKPYQRTLKTMEDKVFIEMQNKCIAKTVLLGWKNVQDDEGNNIPYSSEKALELLNDPENFEFREIVVKLSEEEEVFRKESVNTVAAKSS